MLTSAFPVLVFQTMVNGLVSRVYSSCSLIAISILLFQYSRKQVDNSRREAEADNVKVPTTLAEYCLQYKANSTSSADLAESDDFFDGSGEDDYYMDSSDGEDAMSEPSSDTDQEIAEDSGTA